MEEEEIIEEDLIFKYLKERNKEGNIILLNGSWGSGKTFRWNNDIKKKLEDNGKTTVYISLFGMSSVEEIKQEIFNKFVINKINNSIGNYKKSLFVLYIWIMILGFLLGMYDNYFWVFLFFSVALCLYSHASVIIKYFLNKFVGINHNNIHLQTLFNKEKTTFCFDDFERLSKRAKKEEFFGYFNTISKEYGYNILVISNYNVVGKNCSSSIYKEKIFDYCYRQDEENNIFSILKKYELNDDLKEYLIETYQIFSRERININSYEDSEKKFVENAANLRLIEKIIKNMNMVYNFSSSNEIIKNGNHKELIRYVGTMTLLFELGYCKNLSDFNKSNDVFYIFDDKDKYKNKFRKLFGYLSYQYDSLYDLFYKGIKNEFFYREILPKTYNNFTKLEKLIKNYNSIHCLNYRTVNIEEQIQEIEKNILSENKLFNTYQGMREALGYYSVLLAMVDKSLKKNKLQKIILNQIEELFKKLDKSENILEYIEDDSFSYSTDDQLMLKSFNFINNKKFEIIIKIIYSKYKNEKNVIEFLLQRNEYKYSYVLDIVYMFIIVNSDYHMMKLNSLPNDDYKKFNDLIKCISEIIIDKDMCKRISKSLKFSNDSYNRLINILMNILQDLKDNSKYNKSSEIINYNNFYSKLEKKIIAK